MDSIVFGVWVSTRLEFSVDEKRECFEIAKTLVTIAQKIRKNGLLYLEEEISAMYNAFMKRSLQMAVDGAAPEYLRETMQNWIMFGDHRGAELLKRLIILDGVLMIQRGEKPRQMVEVLASFFGAELVQEYRDYADWQKIYDSVYPSVLMDDFWYKIKDSQMHREEGANLLEKTFHGIDDMSMQVILRNADRHDFIVAAKGSCEYVINRILHNLSSRVAQETVDAIYYIKNVKLADTIAAQNRILARIKELEDSGEISLNGV